MHTSGRSILRSLAATSLVLGLVASATVSVAAQDEAPAVGPGGFVAVPEAGFAITVPLDWTHVRPQLSDLEGIVDALGDMEPEIASMVQSALASSDVSLSLMAFAPVRPVSFAENLNVISLPTSGMSLELITGANVAQLEGLGWPAELTMHELPVGEVAQIDYDATFGDQDLEFSTYLYVDGETQYNLTFTGEERPSDSWFSIASTFEYLPGE